uniref:Uncharacterized protein n=1 Tax=Setaria italica TaxID=4555 RepID=K4AK37_SETIT
MQPGSRGKLIGCLLRCVFLPACCIHVSAAASQEPGSGDTKDLVASWEPDSRRPFTSYEPGPASSAGNQSYGGRTGRAHPNISFWIVILYIWAASWRRLSSGAVKWCKIERLGWVAASTDLPLPGLGGDGGLPWNEDGEEFDADEEEEDQPVPIRNLDALASVIDRPDDFPNRYHVCVVGILFRDTPMMLKRLKEAAAADIGISFVGNLDRLRQAGDLHDGLTRLSESLQSLRATLGTDGAIDWPVVRRALEDETPLLAGLCKAQPESLRDRVLPLLERVKAILHALPDGRATDLDNASGDADARPTTPPRSGDADARPNSAAALVTNAADLDNAIGDADACPNYSAALVTKVAQLLEDMEALVLGGVLLKYPGPGAATFLAMEKEGAQEEAAEQQQRHVVCIEGRQYLTTILEEPHRYFLQSDFSIVKFQMADAQTMFRDIEKAVKEDGWWVGNTDRLEQVSKLHRNLCGISQSLEYVTMMLKNEEMDWWELDNIRRTTRKLPPLCELQPDNLSACILSLVPRIETILKALPDKPDNVEDEPEYPADLFATLIPQ